MAQAFVAPFVEALEEAPVQTIRDGIEQHLAVLEAVVEDKTLKVLMRMVRFEDGLITDVIEQDVEWVVLAGGAFERLEPAELEPLALAYVDGWRAAVQARLEAAEVAVFMPADCVPTASKCPLKLKSLPQTAADFEALFLVKSRLPGLPSA
jgi:hypothetical protein